MTMWFANGANTVRVKDATGHSELRTTMGYTHLAKAHLRALVERVVSLAKPSEQRA